MLTDIEEWTNSVSTAFITQMDSTTFGGGGGGGGAGDISSFASPLEQVFRNVPKAHEKPLRQAVYNVRFDLI